MTIDHFKKCIDSQRKQQSELDTQLLNLENLTQSNFKNMLNEVSLHSKQLIETFQLGTVKQNKEI